MARFFTSLLATHTLSKVYISFFIFNLGFLSAASAWECEKDGGSPKVNAEGIRQVLKKVNSPARPNPAPLPRGFSEAFAAGIARLHRPFKNGSSCIEKEELFFLTDSSEGRKLEELIKTNDGRKKNKRINYAKITKSLNDPTQTDCYLVANTLLRMMKQGPALIDDDTRNRLLAFGRGLESEEIEELALTLKKGTSKEGLDIIFSLIKTFLEIEELGKSPQNVRKEFGNRSRFGVLLRASLQLSEVLEDIPSKELDDLNRKFNSLSENLLEHHSAMKAVIEPPPAIPPKPNPELIPLRPKLRPKVRTSNSAVTPQEKALPLDPNNPFPFENGHWYEFVIADSSHGRPSTHTVSCKVDKKDYDKTGRIKCDGWLLTPIKIMTYRHLPEGDPDQY